MRTMKRILVSAASLLVASTAIAEERAIRLTGGSTSYKYSDLTPGSTLTVYGVSRGNSSNTVKISLYGPSGTKVTASAAKAGKSIAATLSNPRAFYPIAVRADRVLQSDHSECVDFSPGDAFSEEEPEFDPNQIVSTWDPLCDLYPASDMAELGQSLAETYGGSWDIGRVCGYILYMYRGGEGEGELPPLPLRARRTVATDSSVSTEYVAVFHKNACGAASDKYIFRVKLQLPNRLPTSGYLRLRVFETKHYGGKEATIKPVSEGMYAPQPLLLMNYLGFCGQKINVVKWRADKPVSRNAARVYDLIRYRDFVLTRTPFSSYLTGGQASIELYDKNSGYGACFRLERTRQRVNGYPE